MDILGAVAAGVQLATVCYAFQQRICQAASDKHLLELIRKECTTFAAEINATILQLPPAIRKYAQTLCDNLREIVLDIEGLRKRRLLVRVTTILQLRGKVLQETLKNVLTEFQFHAVLAANQVLENIHTRVGENGISAEIQEKLNPLITNLAALREKNIELNNKIDLLTSRNTEVCFTGHQTLVVVRDTQSQLRETRQDMSMALSEISQLRKEIQAIQSQRQPIYSESIRDSPPIDKIDTTEPMANLYEHLKSLYSSGALATEVEIYELLRDVVLGFLSIHSTGDPPPRMSIVSTRNVLILKLGVTVKRSFVDERPVGKDLGERDGY